jgi:anaerobic ribonucleoside-triphosphate reductase activating protein
VKLGLNKLHSGVTTLGYGNRLGIWFQGCSIGCPGCCSRDTWAAPDAGTTIELEEVLAWIAKHLAEGHIDGISVSGGEPLDQAPALLTLLRQLQRYRIGNTQQRPLDILVFTGYPIATVEKQHAALLPLCDSIVAGPYREGRPKAPLAGSNNQVHRLLSPLARKRYTNWQARKSLQVEFDGETLWMIGIPEKGDLEQFEQKLLESGIPLGSASWRS